jgi:hypothetical protein
MFFSTTKPPSIHHVNAATHHDLTTKKPQKMPIFSKTPSKTPQPKKVTNTRNH